MLTRNYAAQVHIASGINILLGIVLLVSPWVLGYLTVGPAAIWNSVIVGALIAILAANRYFSPRARAGLSWVNALLALWIIICPLVCGYAWNVGALRDNVILGVVIAALAIWSAEATTTERKHLPGAPAH